MAKAEQTLETLLANHTRFLRLLEPRVGSREAAEDVLQAAFVKGSRRPRTSTTARARPRGSTACSGTP